MAAVVLPAAFEVKRLSVSGPEFCCVPASNAKILTDLVCTVDLVSTTFPMNIFFVLCVDL